MAFHSAPTAIDHLVLGERRQGAEGGPAWLVRAYVNPWVRLIFSGPFLMALGGALSLSDRRLRLAAPAAWLAAESATPRRRYFTFNHRQDRQAATFAQQLQNLHAMKLDAFGGPVDVDRTPPPFQHSRILTTDYPGGTIDSNTAHTAVITWRNDAVFAPVWLYMLTASVD